MFPFVKDNRNVQTNPAYTGQDVEQNQDQTRSSRDSESEEEAIVVTREEEEIDPEYEAEFEREYAKMMAESLESRKFERKQQFDLPLPVRAKTREPSGVNESGDSGPESRGGTMAIASRSVP
jgi:regulator of nonsense transcripts 2